MPGRPQPRSVAGGSRERPAGKEAACRLLLARTSHSQILQAGRCTRPCLWARCPPRPAAAGPGPGQILQEWGLDRLSRQHRASRVGADHKRAPGICLDSRRSHRAVAGVRLGTSRDPGLGPQPASLRHRQTPVRTPRMAAACCSSKPSASGRVVLPCQHHSRQQRWQGGVGDHRVKRLCPPSAVKPRRNTRRLTIVIDMHSLAGEARYDVAGHRSLAGPARLRAYRRGCSGR